MELQGVPPFELQPYSSAGGRWERWLRHFENYLVARNVTEAAQRKALLQHSAGSAVFDLSDALGVSATTTYEETVAKLNAYFTPKRSVEYETFVFRRAGQQQGETLDAFHARLQLLAKHCAFHDVQREVKSQIIQTCLDERLREKGLSEDALTLEQLLTFGRTRETTGSQMKAMLEPAMPPVHAVNPTIASCATGTVGRPPTAVRAPECVAAARPRVPTGQGSASPSCQGCGGLLHERKACPAWGKSCRKCGKFNHFAVVCRASVSGPRRTHFVAPPVMEMSEACEIAEPVLQLFHTPTRSVQLTVAPCNCNVELNGVPTVMEVDTGSAHTILTTRQVEFLRSSGRPLVVDTDHLPLLRTYSGELLKPEGRATLDVLYAGTTYRLACLIVNSPGPNLLGRDWLEQIRLNWRCIFNVEPIDYAKRFPELFSSGLGKLAGIEAKFHVDDSVMPRCFKPRSVPLALRTKVDAELERLVAEGVLKPAEFSEWAAPIVPVLKPNGDVRICGDYKLTINTAAKLDAYPIPHIEDLYAKLTGGVLYSKLDLSNAYQQVCLHEDSQKFTTITTSKGLFMYTRLCYGVASAPGIFQRIMEQIVQGIPMTAVYLDDIVTSGRTPQQAHDNLLLVLERLQKAGLRLSIKKCSFLQPSCVYLGHKLDATGIHPTPEKLAAIQSAPPPSSVSELRSFLGMINYYHKFLQNLSTVLAPLHKLLQKGVSWHWQTPQQQAFENAKGLLQSSQVLVHYNPDLPLVVSCDASPYGVGAVLSHVMSDGLDRPIAFASRSLTAAERNYAQLEREGLAVVFGVTRFHKYLYGRNFRIYTDHKPLLGLLKEDRLISQMAGARIQRWALTLSNYNYVLCYKSGESNANADGLSRLPLPTPPFDVPVPEEAILSLAVVNSTPVTAAHIAQWTERDPLLSRVKDFVLHGWPEVTSEVLQPYAHRRNELSIEQGVLMWGSRVIVPSPGRDLLLRELHEQHPGMVRMKGLARSYLWWPGLDADIEAAVRDCPTCQSSSNQPAAAPLHPWEWPGQPWHRVHVDYAGPFEGRMILVLVDAHSKFIDAHVVNAATTTATITKLSQSFAMLGMPVMLVTDNGSCFTSDDFERFCKMNGIKHVTTAPYHPASNGLAERAVQTLKAALRKSAGNLDDRLSNFLLAYRVTPQATTGEAPADLVFKRRPRTRLDLVRPSVQSRVLDKQNYDQQRHNAQAAFRTFYEGDCVWARNFLGVPRWLPGVIQEKLGPVTFAVRLQDGRLWRRHQDHLKAGRPDEDSSANERPSPTVPPFRQPAAASDGMTNNRPHSDLPPSAQPPAAVTAAADTRPSSILQASANRESTVQRQHQDADIREAPQLTTSEADVSYRTRSGRTVKPPDRLTL